MIREPLSELEALIRQRLILKGDPEYYAVTLWIAACYAVNEFDFAPRLAIYSPEKRCGKTLLLEVISNCLPNKRLTSSISSAALYRTIEKDESQVILIDEADTTFGRNSDPLKGEALRGVLNGGFKRGQVVTRCDGNSNEPRDYHLFCFVALAGIGLESIPETVRDRSVMIEMRRKLNHESIVEFESDEVDLIFTPIRELLHSWIEANKGIFRASRPILPESLNSRAKDVWKPLFKVAEIAGNEWTEKAMQAALAVGDVSDEAIEVNYPIQLLTDIRKVFEEEKLPTQTLISRLTELEESPWRYMYEKFNPNYLARILRNYGIKSTHWRNFRGYRRSDFFDAWNRYLASEIDGTLVTDVTDGLSDSGDASDVKNEGNQKNNQNQTELFQKGIEND